MSPHDEAKFFTTHHSETRQIKRNKCEGKFYSWSGWSEIGTTLPTFPTSPAYIA